MPEIVNLGSSYGKKMCVSCQTEVEGKRAFPVKEDRVIRVLRAIKKALGVAQMNRLFVCEACMPKHVERRRSFEKTLLFASVLAGIMLLVLIFAPLYSGRFEVWAILSGFVVAGFIVLVPVMFKYVPAVEGAGAPARFWMTGPARPVPPASSWSPYAAPSQRAAPLPGPMQPVVAPAPKEQAVGKPEEKKPEERKSKKLSGKKSKRKKK